MKLNTLFSQKVPLIVLLFVWYYRIFGITFGGLVTKSGECIVNRKLKIFGNIFTISLTILYIIASRIVIDARVFGQIYDSGFTIIYYSITFCREIKDILVVINLYYYQFKGFELFKLLTEYKLTKKQYNLFFLILFSLIFLVQGICALIYLTSFKMNINFLNALFLIILNIFAIMNAFTIHFITWGKNFSIICDELLQKNI
jgi:hypothetical protein